MNNVDYNSPASVRLLNKLGKSGMNTKNITIKTRLAMNLIEDMVHGVDITDVLRSFGATPKKIKVKKIKVSH